MGGTWRVHVADGELGPGLFRQCIAHRVCCTEDCTEDMAVAAAGAGRRRPSRAVVVCGMVVLLLYFSLVSLRVLSSLFFTPRLFFSLSSSTPHRPVALIIASTTHRLVLQVA